VLNFTNYIFFYKRELKKIGIKKIKRFLLVGIVNAISGYTLIILLYSLLNFHFYIANFFGYLFGLIISFILNRKFVFKAKGKIKFQFLKFLFSFFLSYFLNIFVLFNKSIRLRFNLPKMSLFHQLFEMHTQYLEQFILILDFLDLAPIYLLVLPRIHPQLLNLQLS